MSAIMLMIILHDIYLLSSFPLEPRFSSLLKTSSVTNRISLVPTYITPFLLTLVGELVSCVDV